MGPMSITPHAGQDLRACAGRPTPLHPHALLTQAFSKKIENHIYAFALHTMYHNFVKIHGTHRMSPAMAAGVGSRLWEVSDMVAMIEEWEARETVE